MTQDSIRYLCRKRFLFYLLHPINNSFESILGRVIKISAKTAITKGDVEMNGSWSLDMDAGSIFNCDGRKLMRATVLSLRLMTNSCADVLLVIKKGTVLPPGAGKLNETRQGNCRPICYFSSPLPDRSVSYVVQQTAAFS